MPTTRSTLSGQAAIVTGATSGLGRAVALGLAAEGADVALLGRREAELDRVAQEVQDLGVRALPVRVDLAHTADLTSIVDHAVAQLVLHRSSSTPGRPMHPVRSRTSTSRTGTASSQ